MESGASFPVLVQVVLDATDARALAEFYRQLLGFIYRSGDEPPGEGEPDERGHDWLVLHHSSGSPRVAFQQVTSLHRSTWPSHDVPQQLHLDMAVPTARALDLQHQRALDLGGTLVYDRSRDEQEPLRVYVDPQGHPFCIFVAAL